MSRNKCIIVSTNILIHMSRNKCIIVSTNLLVYMLRNKCIIASTNLLVYMSRNKCIIVSTNLLVYMSRNKCIIVSTNLLVYIYDLGVEIDNVLSFETHIHNMVSTANRRIYLIRRCFLSKDVSCLTKAFEVFVRPLLEYCSPVWCPSYKYLVDSVESVQRRFTKYLPGFSSVIFWAPEALQIWYSWAP